MKQFEELQVGCFLYVENGAKFTILLEQSNNKNEE